LIVSLVERWPVFVEVELPFFGWVVVVLARALFAVRRAGAVDRAGAVTTGVDDAESGDTSAPGDVLASLFVGAGVDMTSPVRVTTTI
jgi:hypothetical protein